MVLAARPRAVEPGTDQDCIRDLRTLHVPPIERCLDATWGKGNVWRGLPWYPDERLDIRPLPGITLQGDFRSMPDDWTKRFGWLLFDPPHDTERGKNSTYRERFVGDSPDFQHAANIEHMFAPFLSEAYRVLVPRGIILAKIMDNTHRGRMQWMVKAFLNAVEAQPGLRACDRKILINTGAADQDNYEGEIRHTRTDYVYWICVRKGAC